MALTSSQYNEIMREYDRRQDQVRTDLQRRRDEIDEKIPAYRELTAELAGASLASVRRAFAGGDESAPEDLSRLSDDIRHRKEELLLSHGYPADYLDPKWFCPDCQDTGYIGSDRCHCFRKAAVQLLYRQSALSDVLESENFDHFDESWYDDSVTETSTGLSPRENIREIREVLEGFARGESGVGRSYFLYGNTGVGKTFLCHCVAKEFLDRARGVLFYTAPGLVHLLEEDRFRRGGDDPSATASRIDALYECDLLIIDDLGSELVNTFMASSLLEIMDHRRDAGLSTILSSNLPPSEIRKIYSERIYSRLIRDYVLLKLTGRDIRRRLAER
ncbi:MAG: ATP-binding protein [Lachnospiraceae bacterium]|nr:ATP-binding protein [Lachnospiraceae bacterium]